MARDRPSFVLESDHGDALRLLAMDGRERLGALYEFRVRAASPDPRLDLVGLLGKPMAVAMRMPDGFSRHFHGIAIEAAQTGFTVIDDLRHAVYEIVLAPRLWLLTRRRHSRVFANRDVVSILRAVLDGIGFSDVRVGLSADYPVRETCVQYREDDFAFLSRLMEQEGIYYWFEHDAAKHTLVLADGIGAHAAAKGAAKLPWLAAGAHGMREAVGVTEWRPSSALHATAVRLTDYDPASPRTDLEGRGDAAQGVRLHAVDGLEQFDFPGARASAGEHGRLAQVAVEAQAVARARCSGACDAYGLAAGALFALAGSPGGAWDREYLLTACAFAAREAGDDDAGEAPWQCRFEAIDSRVAFRSPQATPRPLVAGLQTATVCDAGGEGDDEAIAVDRHGRVHVRFHWSDSARGRDQAHSCPVRVATPWAGKQWGAIHIPRVGQEVVVSFLEGDPDRPLIVGSVYNATHMPPYPLPGEKTRSGIRSRSEGGGAEDFNEIRFDDKKGSEELYLHARKDLREAVENDRLLRVERDEDAEIGNDQRLKVTRDRRHEIGNDDTLEVGGKFRLEAGSEIELVTGQSRIVMTSAGEIRIEGIDIAIAGRNAVQAEGGVQVGIQAGATMDVKAGAAMTLKSDAMLTAEGGATATVRSPVLSLDGQGIAQMSAPLIKIG
ncbi:type VI secretion system Vgr family protein [Luteimonas huabeiensis]|uniref:type VI secretion system Vgr family protein n=1 Tax=Luteimonas huabeiensis TaxID=1244513 RepID=UPI00046365D7|nr:type VI secretion system tip protein TssI/VgrG [Luteimonas huabeiensis]